MALRRVVLVTTLILLLALTPALLRGGPASGFTAYAATPVNAPLGERSVGASNENEENDNNRNNNNNGNDNGDENDNNDNNRNGNDNNDNNSNRNDNHSNDNRGVGSPPPSVQSASPAPACSTPGQDSTFSSADGRVSVHVFPSLTQSVKLSILPIDAASVPPPPGQKVDNLLFQIVAEACNGGPIPTLPAEVNLAVRYADADASGLNEMNFTIARLDTSANQWRQIQKQANDPASNFTSATITDMGYYVVYQRS